MTDQVQLLSDRKRDPDEDRLADEVLARDATWLLAHNDAHALTVNLLRTIRRNDDTQNAIRDGYGFSARAREEMHEIQMEAQARHIALAIEAEERKGEWAAPRRQTLTYCGGLRRAARIARGYGFRPNPFSSLGAPLGPLGLGHQK